MNLSAQELFVAYENEDYKKLKELLENGADPNQINESNGMTLMFNTAWDNNLEIAQLLFLHGGKVDMKSSKNDVTPLLPACQENSFDIVKFFVENGANANQKYKVAGNQTPIRFACKTGNIELVEYLINNGAKIEDNPDDGITPLIQASRSNHYDLVKFLIEKGANVNAYARDKEFALNQAIKNGASLVVSDDLEISKISDKIIYVNDTIKTLQELANFHRKFINTKIIAITGSNGKTTSKELMLNVLSKHYKTIATKGNLNNHLGVPLTILSMSKETQIGIVEMGANHLKEIDFLCEIAEPDFGYITNFGNAHLEGFKSLDGVIKGKSELYDYLRINNKLIFYN